MTDDRDPILQRMFANADQDLSTDAFSARVLEQIDTQKRRALLGWTIAGLILVPCAVLVASTMQGFVYLLTQNLTMTLIDLGDGWLTLLLSPVNSVAGALAIGLKITRMAYKKLFS